MPSPAATQRDATRVTIDGRTLVAFGGCDYLGLAHDPDVIASLAAAASRYGLSASASRETTGNTLAHDQLETDLARLVQMPGAIVLPEGYLANVAACQGLARLGVDLAIIDAHGHKSLADAAATAGLEVVYYDHRDARGAHRLVRSHRGRGSAVLTDGVFTADGAVVPLDALLDGLDAWLIVDDCHGLGVLGPGGRGTIEHFGLTGDRLAMTSTLAKGIGVYGGCVAGPTALIEAIRAGATAYRCTTPIPPALAEAARTALGVLTGARSGLGVLRGHCLRIQRALGELGLVDPSRSPEVPIFAFVLEPAGRMDELRDRLLEAGIDVPVIAYPGGPAERFVRLTVSAAHTDEQVGTLIEVMTGYLARAGAV